MSWGLARFFFWMGVVLGSPVLITLVLVYNLDMMSGIICIFPGQIFPSLGRGVVL